MPLLLLRPTLRLRVRARAEPPTSWRLHVAPTSATQWSDAFQKNEQGGKGRTADYKGKKVLRADGAATHSFRREPRSCVRVADKKSLATHLFEVPGASPRQTFLRLGIHRGQAEPRTRSVRPFEVVDQTPIQVAEDLDTVLESLTQRREM